MSINELGVFVLLMIGCGVLVTAAIFIGAVLVSFTAHSTPIQESEPPVAAGATKL